MTTSNKHPAGICSISFRALSPNEVIAAASGAGLDCIEWGGDVHAPPSIGAESLRALGDASRSAGLTVASYGSYHRLGASDPAELTAVFAAAKALGAPVVRVWAGTRGTRECTAEERNAVHAATREAAMAASREKLTISFECHPNTLTDDPEETLSLLREGPPEALGTHWQPNQFHAEEWNIAYATEVADRVQAIHVFNWSLDPDGKVVRHPLSGGAVSWHRYLAILPSSAPRFLEFVPGDDPDVLTREAAALRKIAAM